MKTLCDTGYHSKSMEAGGFQSDQFLKPPKSRKRWYNILNLPDPATARPGRSVHYSSSDASKLNSLYSRIAKASGTGLVHPPCRPLPQETVRKWEKAGKPPVSAIRQQDSIVVSLNCRTKFRRTSGSFRTSYPKAKVHRRPRGQWMTCRTCAHLTRTFPYVWGSQCST